MAACVMLWRVVLTVIIIVGNRGAGGGGMLNFTSESDLYASKLWTDETTRAVIFKKGGTVPSSVVSTISSRFSRVGILVAMVTCDDLTSSTVCDLFREHFTVIKGVDGVWGVEGMGEEHSWTRTEIVVKIVESILGNKLTHVSSLTEYTDFSASYPNHFLVLTSSTLSPEYLEILDAMISLPVISHPLVVTMKAEVLSLLQYPSHTLTSPLHLWMVSGPELYQCMSCSGSNTMEKVEVFVKRSQLPAYVDYSDGSIVKEMYADSGLPVVHMFYQDSTRSDVVTLAQDLAAEFYANFGFVLVNSNQFPEVAKDLYLSSPPTEPMIIIIRGTDTVRISPDSVPFQLNHLSGLFQSIIVDFDGTVGVSQPSTPSIFTVNPASLQEMMREKSSDLILAAFCKKDSSSCLDYLSQLESIVNDFSLYQLIAVVVECDSVKDVENFSVKTLPAFSFYSSFSSPNWKTLDQYSLIEQLTAMLSVTKMKSVTNEEENGLLEDTRKLSEQNDFVLLDPLKEDDHFGQVFKVLPEADVPSHLHLTPSTFYTHVTKYGRTLVAFYVKWCVRCKVFLHHFMAAVIDLPESLDISLALVHCWDWPDLCKEQGVTSYPTVHLFQSLVPTPSHIILTGILDSRALLRAVGVGEEGEKLEEQEVKELENDLTELTHSTLPSLLAGQLNVPLVVWCSNGERVGHVTSKIMKLCKNYGFHMAWMNGSHYDNILRYVMEGGVHCPALLIWDFGKHMFHHLPVAPDFNGDELSRKLEEFLTNFTEGNLHGDPLAQQQWPPLQPPIVFPSSGSGRKWRGEGRGPEERSYDDDSQMRHSHQHTEL